MSTALFRGDGGTVWEMDLPLSKAMEEQLAAGKLVRVDEDGRHVIVPKLVEVPDSGVDADDSDGEDDVPPELKAFLDAPPEPPAKPTAPKAKQK